MNITQLRYFHAVCTFHSVSAAAEYLHISQPSLSNAIRELENEFGVVLFRRHYRGMTLTQEGEALYKSSGEILKSMEQAEDLMRDLGKERKRLRLGVPPMIGSLILPNIYRHFVPDAPEITLEITEGGRREVMQKLQDGLVDMVFLSHSDPLEREYAAMKVAQLPIVCCTTRESPIASLPCVKPADVAQTPLVLFGDSFFQTEKIRQWFAGEGITPKVILQTQQLSTMLSILSHEIAAGFMFRQLVEANPSLIPIPTEAPLLVDVSLVWRKDTHISHSMRRFTEYMKTENPFEQA